MEKTEEANGEEREMIDASHESNAQESNFLKEKDWSPYVAGALIGVLSWIAFATVGRGLGITTAFEDTAALGMKALGVASEGVSTYTQDTSKDPKIGWEWTLVIGVFIGSWLSASFSGSRDRSSIPKLWQDHFGSSASKRLVTAFFGGLVMMVGARLAQGCTSGHGITGILQFAISSWIFVPVFGLTGWFIARNLFHAEQEEVPDV